MSVIPDTRGRDLKGSWPTGLLPALDMSHEDMMHDTVVPIMHP